MIINEKMYKSSIKSDVLKLDLIEKAKKDIYNCFKEWPKNELNDYLCQDFNFSKLEDYLKLVKIGVQINVNQEELLLFSVVFQINSLEDSFLCNYYSYFDIQGKLIDSFPDK